MARRCFGVLPPLNNTPAVRATYSMLAQVTHPLSELGYCVIPVPLMDQTFRENGIQQAADAHGLQVMGPLIDQSHPMAGLASHRLLRAGRPDGLLQGPRSPTCHPN